MNNDIDVMLKSYWFDLSKKARRLALNHISASEGVAEYILARHFHKCPPTENAFGDTHKLFLASHTQGYWRGTMELIPPITSFGVKRNKLTNENRILEDELIEQYFQEAWTNANNAYDIYKSADAAAFLGSVYCGDGGYPWIKSVQIDRGKGLMLLHEAYEWGFEPIAAYLARVTFAVGDSRISNEWGSKYWACRSSFIDQWGEE